MEIESYIKQLLSDRGYLPIDELMSIAMTQRNNSYYRTTQPLGKYGDFITAPEISQMFAEMIAVWCVHIWQQLYSPSRINIIELGPGKGTLLSDILRATKNVKYFHNSVHLILVEVNDKLMNIQRHNLLQFDVPIRWIKSIESIDNNYPTIILANEFFDALPVKQYVRLHDENCNFLQSCMLPKVSQDQLQWYEQVVKIDTNSSLYFDKIPVTKGSKMLQELELHSNARCGAVIEASRSQHTTIMTIGNILKQNNGVCLIVDYGYYLIPEQRSHNQYNSTLQAVKDHKYHAVLNNLGTADLSAHVDFYALKEVALRTGMKVFDPVPQGALLRSLGIDLRLAILKQKNKGKKSLIQELEQQYYRLTANEEMGLLFKAMAIAASASITPPGFECNGTNKAK